MLEANWSQVLWKLVKCHATEQQWLYNIQPDQKPGIKRCLITEDFTDRAKDTVFRQ